MKTTKKFTTSLLLGVVLLFSSASFAGVKVDISGQVKDKTGNEALLFCSVSVYSLNDSLITGGITNDKGYFSIPLEEGKYKVLFSYTGYKSDTLEVAVNSSNVFLGTIKLEPSSTEIGEVSVVANIREQKIDREVQLVTKDLRIGTANATDILGKMQGISIDRYSKTIKVDGSDNVILLVNGLEKEQDYIKNLSPNMIKEIEIIRNPSGRYALEGYTAVINVVLKTDYSGSEVTLSNDTYADLDSKNGQYALPVNYFSLTYNYTRNKTNFYTKYRNIYNEFTLFNNSLKTYDTNLSVEQKPFKTEPNQYSKYLANQYVVGFDYYINPKHTLSFESNLQALPLAQISGNESYMISQNNNGVISDFTTERNNQTQSKNFSNTLFYVYRINQSNKLTTDFNFTHYSDNTSNSFALDQALKSSETGINTKNSINFNSELEHNINEKSSFTLGYGNTWRQLDFENTTGNISNTVSTSDSRHKLYAYYSSKLSKIVSLKMGAAAETSNPKVDNLETRYTIYQPYADVKFDLHKYLSLKAKYRAESAYPSIEQALPFSYTIDNYTTEQGNPNLKPSLTHKISVNVFAVMGLFNIEPYYNFSENKIIRAIEPQTNGTYQFNYYNAEKFNSKGFKTNLTIPLFDQSLIIQSSLNYYQNSITHQSRTSTVKDWKLNSQIIYISKKHNAMCMLMYQKNLQKDVTAQGYTMDGLNFWLLYAQKNFFEERLTLSLGYILPVNMGINYTMTQYTEANMYKEISTSDLGLLKNVVTFGIKYNFNRGNKIKTENRSVKEDVERKSKSLF